MPQPLFPATSRDIYRSTSTGTYAASREEGFSGAAQAASITTRVPVRVSMPPPQEGTK